MGKYLSCALWPRNKLTGRLGLECLFILVNARYPSSSCQDQHNSCA